MTSLIVRVWLATFLLPALCQAEQQFSLLQTYKLAREAAPELALARYRVDGAEARKGVAMGRILPQANLFGQWSKNEVNYDGDTSFPDRNYPGERYGIQVKQALLNVSDGLEAMRLGLVLDQTEDELAVAELELLRALNQRYLDALLADALLDQVRAELTALQTQEAEAQALYERRLLPVTQLLETQARMETLGVEVIRAEGAASVAREELYKLTGSRGYSLQEVAESFALSNRFPSPEEAVAATTASSPAIAALEAALKAARRGVDREKGSWIPNIDLLYNYQYSDVGFDNTSSPARDTSTIAVGFSYPLFEGGAGSARLRGAWAEYYSAQVRLTAQRRESELQARSAWLNFEASAKQVSASRQALTSAETSVLASRKAVSAGVSRVTDVLVALAQETRAQREYSVARFQYVMAWLELELLTGSDPVALAPRLSKILHGS